MRLERLDRWLGPSLTLLALAWLWLVYTYIPAARAEGEPGPRAFPILLGCLLGALGMIMTASALLSGRGEARTETISSLTRREAAFASGTFGLLILYAFLLDTVGFVIATAVVIALTMCGLLRMRRWALILSLSVGFTLGCWVIFDAVLGTPLPRGSWMMWL